MQKIKVNLASDFSVILEKNKDSKINKSCPFVIDFDQKRIYLIFINNHKLPDDLNNLVIDASFINIKLIGEPVRLFDQNLDCLDINFDTSEFKKTSFQISLVEYNFEETNEEGIDLNYNFESDLTEIERESLYTQHDKEADQSSFFYVLLHRLKSVLDE